MKKEIACYHDNDDLGIAIKLRELAANNIPAYTETANGLTRVFEGVPEAEPAPETPEAVTAAQPEAEPVPETPEAVTETQPEV